MWGRKKKKEQREECAENRKKVNRRKCSQQGGLEEKKAKKKENLIWGYRMKNQREVESWREIFRCRDEVMENFQERSRTNV